MKTWHVANTGNDQGLVIEDESGANIAVTYDVRDAALVAEAPAMAEALRACVETLADSEIWNHRHGGTIINARAILARIEGK